VAGGVMCTALPSAPTPSSLTVSGAAPAPPPVKPYTTAAAGSRCSTWPLPKFALKVAPWEVAMAPASSSSASRSSIVASVVRERGCSVRVYI
jgi:hypothetical protein